MIQDIAPKILHNEYINKEPKEDGRIIIFSGNEVLLRIADGKWELPEKKEIESKQRCQYLFCVDKQEYFLMTDFKDNKKAREHNILNADFVKMHIARAEADKELCFVLYTAYHLYQWYRDNQYCGRCGVRTIHSEKERMLYCNVCGNMVYPKIAPAVIVAVTNGDQILLTKYAGRDYKEYALIAGFMEIGETAEQTVRREVMEEVGLHVKNIRYYKTQPWGTAGNFLIGYFAQLEGDSHIHMDNYELSCAEWADREKLKDMDDGFSLTREMMRVFYENKELEV